MWIRKRLDLGWSDLHHAMWYCGLPCAHAEQSVADSWSPNSNSLVCLSVRTGFDLLFQALNLPAGSEVLVSALTIDGMLRVIEEHDLVAVPVDLDPETMAPTVDTISKAVSEKSRVLVVAHLFGAHVDLSAIQELARDRGLLLVEDCAQAFEGTPKQEGNGSDVVMYSFGPIKTATALGGAILDINDDELLHKMKQIEQSYPTQSRWFFMRRVMKYAMLKSISYKLPFSTLVSVLKVLGKDYDKWIKGAVRGFKGKKLFRQLRQRPSRPLLSLLNHRIQKFDQHHMEPQRDKGDWLCSQINSDNYIPGTDSLSHNYWTFPVVVPDPETAIKKLRKHGFDAGQRGSMVVVPTPEDRPELNPTHAEQLINKIVFIPLYPALPKSALQKMADVVNNGHAE